MNEDLKNLQYFNILDNQILNNHSNYENVEELLSDTDSKIYAHQNVPDFYSKDTKFYNSLLESPVVGEVLKQADNFATLGIDIKDVVNMICHLGNILNLKDFNRLPDRYICRRMHAHKNYITSALIQLSRTKILDIRYINNKLFIKLNRDLIINDEYITAKRKSFWNYDSSFYNHIMDKYDTLYYYDYCFDVALKHKREDILGFTVAYAELCGTLFESDRRKADLAKYGSRQDIMYAEIPMHIISIATFMPIKDIRSYCNKLCTFAPYISKRDKVYDYNKIFSPYYNENYKDHNLISYKSADNSERALITENSVIIYKDAFLSSKAGKNVMKNLDYYKRIILNILKNNRKNKLYDAETDDKVRLMTLNYINSQDFIDQTNPNNFKPKEIKNGQSILNLKALHQRQHKVCMPKGKIISVHLDKLNLDKAIYLFKIETQKLNENEFIGKRAFKTTVKNLKLLNNFIQSKLNDLIENEVNISSYINRIKKYDLESQFSF